MKKLTIFACVAILLVCFLAISISAEECVHTDNWEVKLSSEGALGDWEAINICPNCNTVLKDEFYEPLVESWGYSYFDGSFTQGFEINTSAVDKYEAYTGKSFEYGVVAGVVDIVGNSPVNSDGTTKSDKTIVFNLSKNNTEHFEIKVVNVPKTSVDEKIIACAYIIDGGEVLYGDNEKIDSRVAGITYNEVVGLLKNGDVPQGFEEFRALSPEEMDIICGGYWHSNGSPYNSIITDKSDSVKNFATRMFTRDELPSGSYVVVSDNWQFRPELWKTDDAGKILKNTTRPYGSNISGSERYLIDEMWAKDKEFDYLAFNISMSGDNYASKELSAECVASVFQIFVPYSTKLTSVKAETVDSISVEGMMLMAWDNTNLYANAYWNCQNGTSISKGNTTAKAYYATKQFKKAELPVGSVIEINKEFMYRPEYWVNSAKVGSRASVTDTYRIVITEDFWDTESERAFNVSTITKEALTADDYETVANAFRIYLPVEER